MVESGQVIELTDCRLIRQPGKKRFELLILDSETGEEIGYADGLKEALRMVEIHRRLVKEGKNGLSRLPKRSVRSVENDATS